MTSLMSDNGNDWPQCTCEKCILKTARPSPDMLPSPSPEPPPEPHTHTTVTDSAHTTKLCQPHTALVADVAKALYPVLACCESCANHRIQNPSPDDVEYRLALAAIPVATKAERTRIVVFIRQWRRLPHGCTGSDCVSCETLDTMADMIAS